MSRENRDWLSSRASLGEALTAIGVPDIGDLELALPSTKLLVLKRNGIFYRFATNNAQARDMQRELVLLARIGPRLSVKVPEILQSSSQPVFHAYRGIAGVGLDAAKWAGLGSLQRERVVTTLALFLFELHQFDTEWCESEDRDNGSSFAEVAAEAALDHYDMVDPTGIARRFAMETAELYETSRPERPTGVLLHDDLAGSNILIDQKSGDVVGIIDFTDWCVGDHHRDFWFLRRFGGDNGLKTAVRAYEAQSGRRVDLDFVMAIERARLCRGLLLVKQPLHVQVDRIVGLMTTWRPLA